MKKVQQNPLPVFPCATIHYCCVLVRTNRRFSISLPAYAHSLPLSPPIQSIATSELRDLHCAPTISVFGWTTKQKRCRGKCRGLFMGVIESLSFPFQSTDGGKSPVCCCRISARPVGGTVVYVHVDETCRRSLAVYSRSFVTLRIEPSTRRRQRTLIC